MQNSSRMHTELAHNSTRTLWESIENSFRTHFIESSCNSFRTPLNFSITHSESIQEPTKSHLELKELFQSSTGLIPDYLKQTENPVPSTRRCRETNWYRSNSQEEWVPLGLIGRTRVMAVVRTLPTWNHSVLVTFSQDKSVLLQCYRGHY